MTKAKTQLISKTGTYNFKIISTGTELNLTCAKEEIRETLDKLLKKEVKDYVCVIDFNNTPKGNYLNELVVGKFKKEVTLDDSIKPKETPKVSDVDFVSASDVQNTFEILNKVKCNVMKKGKFNYMSWTDCWREVKRMDYEATFKVYENEQGFPAWIKKDVGGFVKVGVTIKDLEHIEHYPITNNYNKTILTPDTMDINTAIKRALVKATAFHGLGLYIYQGDDLPEEDDK